MQLSAFTPSSTSQDKKHLNLFRRFVQWLRPGGLLLFTIAKKDDGPGYTEDDFFGETMYWSNFGPSTYEKFLTETGFQIEREGIVRRRIRKC